MKQSLLAVLAALFSNAAAQSCGESYRKPWRSLSCTERTTFLDAVQQLKDSGTYDEFVRVHYQNRAFSHSSQEFLPWHRWYILKYEQELQSISGTCLTLPYWDWERDAADEFGSSVLQAETFGSSSGTERSGRNRGCVNEGIANGWNPVSGSCLTRAFNNVAFSNEARMIDIVVNNPDYVDFRPSLEGTPHAAPHNFIGGSMANFYSPDDPLFFLHHANVDRMWALYQDYHDHDLVDVSAISSGSSTYFVPGTGRTFDTQMPFFENSNSASTPSKFLLNGASPSARDVFSNADLNVQYGDDNLAFIIDADIGDATWSWITPASVAQSFICSDGSTTTTTTAAPTTTTTTETSSTSTTTTTSAPTTTTTSTTTTTTTTTTTASPKSNNGKKPNGRRLLRSSAFSNPEVRTRFDAERLANPGMSGKELVRKVARQMCTERGNPSSASPEWAQMMNMDVCWLKCFADCSDMTLTEATSCSDLTQLSCIEKGCRWNKRSGCF